MGNPRYYDLPEHDDDGGVNVGAPPFFIRKSYSVSWPISCLGCGLEDLLMLKGHTILYTKDTVKGTSILYLCDTCTTFAQNEQRALRISRAASFIISVMLIFPFGFRYAHFQYHAPLTYILLFLIWIPFYFGARLRSILKLQSYNSYFDTRIATSFWNSKKRSLNFSFRNEAYLARFKEKNPHLLSKLNKKMRFGYIEFGYSGDPMFMCSAGCVLILLGISSIFLITSLLMLRWSSLDLILRMLLGFIPESVGMEGILLFPFIYSIIIGVSLIVERFIFLISKRIRS